VLRTCRMFSYVLNFPNDPWGNYHLHDTHVKTRVSRGEVIYLRI
jgi:hypothetical protein